MANDDQLSACGRSPRWLAAEAAAAYLGVCADEFIAEVEAGVWPNAARFAPSCGPLWDIRALDRRSDKLSNLADDSASRPLCDEFLTLEEVAAAMRCSCDTVYRIPKSELPVHQPGKVNLYFKPHVIAYIRSKQRGAASCPNETFDDRLRKFRAAA
jgi:hypothetical protein